MKVYLLLMYILPILIPVQLEHYLQIWDMCGVVLAIRFKITLIPNVISALFLIQFMDHVREHMARVGLIPVRL